MVGYYISLPCSVVIDYRCEVKPFLTGTVDPRKDMEIKCELPFLNFLNIFFSYGSLQVNLSCHKRKKKTKLEIPSFWCVWGPLLSPYKPMSLLQAVSEGEDSACLSAFVFSAMVIACFIPDLTLQHLPVLYGSPWCHCCPCTL